MAVGGGYFYFTENNNVVSEEAASFYVVETVSRGAVTSGIETTGDIIAAQKLDIDVYKQLSRIEAVNVTNGGHVEAGDVLISFDKSDAYVDTQASQVAVAEAELALQEEESNAVEPSTAIRSKENQIAGYQKTIVDAEQDKLDAYRDFLNENLEVTSHPDYSTTLSSRVEPVLSGEYLSDVEGEYVIEVYASAAESGFTYKVSGLESMTEPVIFGKTLLVGSRGLKVTFPNDTKSRDKWVISIPNDTVPEYQEALRDYQETITNLEKTIADTSVNLANAEQELVDLQTTDSSDYRNLSVERAQSSLTEARQRLYQNYEVVQELDIVAPFSGSVEGMENVVEGATPTGGTNDSINLGTLISDEFLTTFSLGATDIAKVEVGQKVKVTVTSFTEQPVFDAYITQISSLPQSSGVAQYEVQALLDYDRASADIVLREGMLADIEVVEEENVDALRVPTAAVAYEQGVPKVTIIDRLSEEQQQQVERMGIVRTDNGTLATYAVEVELGIVGQYYVEIFSGVTEGQVIVSSALTETASESVVQQSGFGPPGGGERPNNGSGPPTN